MIPEDRLATQEIAGGFIPPTNRYRDGDSLGYELGGVAVADASEGLDYQVWIAEVRSTGTEIYIYPEEFPEEASLLITGTSITALSLAFDQLMRPTCAFVDSGVHKLYWFDSVANDFVTTVYADNTAQTLFMDHKASAMTNLGLNDVLFFYIRDGDLYYRQQRDRYTVERLMESPAQGTRIARAGLMRNNRVGVQYGSPTEITYVEDSDRGILAEFTYGIDPNNGPLTSNVLLNADNAVINGDNLVAFSGLEEGLEVPEDEYVLYIADDEIYGVCAEMQRAERE